MFRPSTRYNYGKNTLTCPAFLDLSMQKHLQRYMEGGASGIGANTHTATESDHPHRASDGVGHLLQCQLEMVLTYHRVELFSVELRHTDWKGMVHAVDVLPKDSDTHYLRSIEQSSRQTSRIRVEYTASFSKVPVF